MKSLFFWFIRTIANLQGKAKNWYLCHIYLPVVLQGQDVNTINVFLSHADMRETRCIVQGMKADIHPTAYIETHLMVHNARCDYGHLRIGPQCYVGKDCFFDLSEPITCEPEVTIAMRVTILTHFDAGRSSISQVQPQSSAPVRIKRGAYVGAGAIVMPGVTIGEGATIGAGAVVTKDVQPHMVVAGVPARRIYQPDIDRQANYSEA